MQELLQTIAENPDRTTAITAVVALIIAAGSAIIACATFMVQRTHNRKSVSPVAEFVIGDYENQIEVAVTNKGIGPLIVDRLNVHGGPEVRGDLISLMPDHPERIGWTTFTGDITKRCLSPGEKLSILLLQGDPDSVDFAEYRDQVRMALHPLEIEIEYSDVYSKSLDSKKRSLDWFGRRLVHDGAVSQKRGIQNDA